MTTRLRRPMLVLGTALLLIQAVFMPIGMVYAETISQDKNVEETGALNSEMELPPPLWDDTLENDEYMVKQENNSDNYINEEIASRNLSSFPLWGNIENGELVSGSELLPIEYTRLEVSAKTRLILNGVDITGSAPNSRIRIPDNSILKFTNIGIHNGQAVDAEWSIGTPIGQVYIELSMGNDQNSSYLNVNATGIGRTGRVPVTIKHIYSGNGQQIPGYVNMDQRIYTHIQYRIDQPDLHALFSNRAVAPRRTIRRENNQYGFVDTNEAIFNRGFDELTFITNSSVKIELEFMPHNNIVGSPIQVYSKNTENLSNNSPLLILEGESEEEDFVSHFSAKQEVGTITEGSYDLIIEYDPLLYKEMTIETITDSYGNNLSDDSELIYSVGSIQVVISAQKMAELRGKSIHFNILGTIDKDAPNLTDFLEVDYLNLPLKGSTNYSEDIVTAKAQTWARPWGEAVHQEIGLNTSTSELDPADFIKNLDNKLVGDAPFAVGFAEAREFDTLGETSIGVVIESAISGIQNTIDVPVTVIENKGSVFVHHVDKDGKTLSDSEELIGIIGEAYETQAKIIKNYHVTEEPDNAKGVYQEKAIDVTYIYDIAPVLPVNPLDPDKEITPENPPVLPEDQGLFSIDFVSQFDFGSQVISAQDQTYYAKTQRLVGEDGSVIEGETRPNYVQISDRRSEQERDGWELAVRQNEQFHTETGKELAGARLILQNQQVATAQGGIEPGLQHTNPMGLIPGGAKRTLLKAQGPEGVGTWIYRFGDADSATQSVALEVPKGATPSAESYTTTLTWELSSVPNN